MFIIDNMFSPREKVLWVKLNICLPSYERKDINSYLVVRTQLSCHLAQFMSKFITYCHSVLNATIKLLML